MTKKEKHLPSELQLTLPQPTKEEVQFPLEMVIVISNIICFSQELIEILRVHYPRESQSIKQVIARVKAWKLTAELVRDNLPHLIVDHHSITLFSQAEVRLHKALEYVTNHNMRGSHWTQARQELESFLLFADVSLED